MDTYTTAEAAATLGVSQARVRQLAQDRKLGERTIDGWRFTTADITRMERRPAGRPPQRVRDYLTLSPNEAALITDMLNGHLRTEGVAARDELTLSLIDSVGPNAEGARLDTQHGVEDWRSLVVRVTGLSEPQAAGVIDAAGRYWREFSGLPLAEGLAEAGLL